jgi:hypothetical protein
VRVGGDPARAAAVGGDLAGRRRWVEIRQGRRRPVVAGEEGKSDTRASLAVSGLRDTDTGR